MLLSIYKNLLEVPAVNRACDGENDSTAVLDNMKSSTTSCIALEGAVHIVC